MDWPGHRDGGRRWGHCSRGETSRSRFSEVVAVSAGVLAYASYVAFGPAPESSRGALGRLEGVRRLEGGVVEFEIGTAYDAVLASPSCECIAIARVSSRRWSGRLDCRKSGRGITPGVMLTYGKSGVEFVEVGCGGE
jgi:hypothetical protein